MLVELRVENFAVIESLTLRPEPGLNALTGETGAGKSILVGALALLLGERASAEAVRAGKARAVVEGVFLIAGQPDVVAMLEDRGIGIEDDLVVLRREIAAEGRSRAWINGAASTATLIGDIGRRLVDLHGQHEHQTLLHAEPQRQILDAFAAAGEVADRTADRWRDVGRLQNDLDTLDARRRETAQRADFLRFQAEEIERAAINAGEDIALEQEASRLEHAEELARLSQRLHQSLYAADDSIPAQLAMLRKTLANLIRLDASRSLDETVLEEAYHALQELGRQLGEYSSAIEHNPARLEELRRRQDLLFRLQAKYGPSLADVIAAGHTARQELIALDGIGFERKAIEEALTHARAEHLAAVESLSTARQKAAARLDKRVNEVLGRLGMPGGHFVTDLVPLSSPGATGAESVEFRVTVNAGFEPGPLARIASGGELSRIMLALKSILAREDRIPSLVFDEIDAGIGGRVAIQVADRLRDVARDHQVFVVTHLPQIASRADHHLVVEKAVRAGRASTAVRAVSGEARIRELARMLSGDPDSHASLEHARDLLEAR
ncbi:MAG: DNA repair protein RecN [Longimicrobiales bacterium]